MGILYCGRVAIYFYSLVNYKTLVGKSTKIRLNYSDIRSVQKAKLGGLILKMDVAR